MQEFNVFFHVSFNVVERIGAEVIYLLSFINLSF